DRGGRLVEDREALVDDLDEVIRTDGAVRVGWRRGHGEGSRRPAEPLADPVEAEAEDRRSGVPEARLDDRIRRAGSGNRQSLLRLLLLLVVGRLVRSRRNLSEGRGDV